MKKQTNEMEILLNEKGLSEDELNNIIERHFEEIENKQFQVKESHNLADELTDIIFNVGIYPMDIWSANSKTFEIMCERNGVHWFDPLYVKAVLPVLIERDPSAYEATVSIIEGLKAHCEETKRLRSGIESEIKTSDNDLSKSEKEAEDTSELLADHTLKIVADKVHHALASNDVSEESKDAFVSILFEAANEAGLSLGEPEFINQSMPKIIKTLDFEYGRAVVHSLQALLESNLLTGQLHEELKRYEKRFAKTS